ncbi:MAG: cupin domain-containing protein [Pseudomonadota bacterium]|nr:cupin domain-containing protein [Pseudomonadota bacterium]
MADLHGDRNLSVVVDTTLMDWQPSPSPGVWRKRLELVGDSEKGMVTSVVKFAPGAQFSDHAHPLGEEVLVLDGTFADEHGTYPRGSFTLLPTGSRHHPVTPEGCTLFVKLCQYSGADRPTKRLDSTDAAAWIQTGPGRRIFPVFNEDKWPEKIYLARLDPGVRIPLHDHAAGGEELFVIEGSLADENGHYRAGTWLRFAPGSEHAPYTDTGCLLYVKIGHMG